VEAALQAADGNQSRTARLLGVTPRCVYNKMRKHRLANDGSAPSAGVPERPFRSDRVR
jgi:DNA-binding NtrC family response regulator